MLRDHANRMPSQSFGVREEMTYMEIGMMLGSQPLEEAASCAQRPFSSATELAKKHPRYFRSSQEPAGVPDLEVLRPLPCHLFKF